MLSVEEIVGKKVRLKVLNPIYNGYETVIESALVRKDARVLYYAMWRGGNCEHPLCLFRDNLEVLEKRSVGNDPSIGHVRKRGHLADLRECVSSRHAAEHFRNRTSIGITTARGNNGVWKIGNGDVELIEFGSFNPDNENFVEGGKVIAKI